MKLKINTIITLENNKKYVLLNETFYNNKHYFLVMEITSQKEVIPDKVAIFEEILNTSEIYVEKVNDPQLIAYLTQVLKAQL